MIPSFKISNNEIECIKLYNSFEFNTGIISDKFKKVCNIFNEVCLQTSEAFSELGKAFKKIKYKSEFHKAIGKVQVRA